MHQSERHRRPRIVSFSATRLSLACPFAHRLAFPRRQLRKGAGGFQASCGLL